MEGFCVVGVEKELSCLYWMSCKRTSYALSILIKCCNLEGSNFGNFLKNRPLFKECCATYYCL